MFMDTRGASKKTCTKIVKNNCKHKKLQAKEDVNEKSCTITSDNFPLRNDTSFIFLMTISTAKVFTK